MFTRADERENVDPYFRALYLLQLIAALSMIAGMALTWWDGDTTYNVFSLLARSIERFKDENLLAVFQPLLVLWLLWPAPVISLLRGVTGVMVTPVSYRWLALLLAVIALLVLAHFHINFGDDDLKLAETPLAYGQVAEGFWLTGSSAVLLTLMILMESIIKPRRLDRFAPRESPAEMDDAERIWRGEYQTCPYCGTLNEPGAKSCYNCHNLLFDFMSGEK